MKLYDNFLEKNVPKELRHNFTISIYMQLFMGLFCGCYASFFGVIARDQFHASPFWIGLIYASMNITGLLGFFISTIVPQGKEGKYGFIIYIVSTLFLIVCPLARTAELFCTLLFFFHLFACYSPLECAVYGYVFPMNLRSKMLGYVKIFSSISNMAVTLIVGLVINMTWGGVKAWAIIFVCGGIFHILRGFFFSKYEITAPKNPEKINFWKSIISSLQLLIKDKFNYIVIISTTLLATAVQMFNTLYPMYQVDVLQINGREVSILTVTSSIATIIAYPFIGNYFSKKNPIKSWFFVFPFAIILPLFYVFCGKSWYPLILGYILNPAFSVVNDLIYLNLIIYLGGNEKIKEYQGLYSLINGVRAVIALYLGTYFINHCEHLQFSESLNFKIAFLVGIALISLAFLVTLGLLKFKKERK